MKMFVHRHRVRSYEVDHQGFMFNARYLEIADAAMTELYRSLGYGYPQLIDIGFDPAVVTTELQFRTPARLDDELAVDVCCEHIGTTSFVLLFTCVRRGHELAEIRTTYVNVNATVAESVPIPDEMRTKLVTILQAKATS